MIESVQCFLYWYFGIIITLALGIIITYAAAIIKIAKETK